MKRRRSRGRRNESDFGKGNKRDEVPETIQALMGSDAKIYSLFEFVEEYAPSLPVLEPLEETPDYIRLRNTLVCPLQSLEPCRCRRVECTESISSLVDDVIWTLVQRRSKEKTRNVFAHGYILASEQLSQTHYIRPCQQMRPGVVCTHMNDNVSFCKTSSYAQTLHRLVGDDVVRTLLLHTFVFLPVEQDWNRRNQNYLILCGPPLCGTQMTKKRTRALTKESCRTGRRRKRRMYSHPTKTTLHTTSKQQTLKGNHVLPRSSLFYNGSFVPKVGLPSTHILNQRPEKCQLLLLTLLGSGTKGRNRWKQVRELGISLCQEIFRRHETCDYHRLLNRYCPLPEFCRESSTATSGMHSPTAIEGQESPQVTLPQVSAADSPSDGVVSFLRAALRQVFSPEFWGSEHNFEQVLTVAETFVNLRRQEKLPIKALMSGIRVKDVVWVYGDCNGTGKFKNDMTPKKDSWPKSLHEAVMSRVCNVMKWVFAHYIIPLLCSIFYITESEFSAKRVLFYRKPVWSIFRSLSMKKLLVRQYKELSRGEAESLVLHQKMGLSKLRLLPKTTGVRALALLSKREFANVEKLGSINIFSVRGGESDNGTEAELVALPAKRAKLHGGRSARPLNPKFSSTNAILRNVFEILRYERERHPELFGSGVFGLNEVYPEYRRFLEAFRALKAFSSSNQLYFASVDIKQCYDSIVQQHLLNILPKLLGEEEYLIQNSAVIHPFESMGRVIRRPVRRVGAPESYSSFQDEVEGLARDYNRSVFMDNGGSCVIRRDDIMELLQEHLLSHIVVIRGRYGDRFLLQTSGIPQGSILSTLLCNYYYGHVEQALLGSIMANKSVNISCISRNGDGHLTLLVRIVDDFLLVTTSKDLSDKFLTIMTTGSDELGVSINKDKTLVNYPVQIEGSGGVKENLPRPDVETGNKEQTVFPWCGMLFDMETGDIHVDYSRFADGKATDALTVDRAGAEGQQLEIRMKSFVRPRCQPMLFDSRINGARTVGINFCQALLLCAVKALCYIEGMEGGIQKNVDFIVRNIDDVTLYTHKLITDRLRKKKAKSDAPQESFLEMTRQDAMWLGRIAFLTIFRRIKGCNDVVALLAPRCASPGRHPMQDIADEAIRQFDTQVGSKRL